MNITVHHGGMYYIYKWSKTDKINIELESSGKCTKEMWAGARSTIYDMVVHDDPCQGEITQKYIFGEEKDVPKKPVRDLKIIARRTQGIAYWPNDPAPYHYRRDIMMVASPGPKAVGFLLGCDADFASKNAYYIDIVCAIKNSGGGTPLMSTFIHHFNDRDIKLSALISVLNWYPAKFNFEYGSTCAEAAKLKPELAGIGDNFTSIQSNIYSHFHPNTKKAFEQLINLKLDNASSIRTECVNSTAANFFKNDCENEGFHMIRCKPRKSSNANPRESPNAKPRKLTFAKSALKPPARTRTQRQLRSYKPPVKSVSSESESSHSESSGTGLQSDASEWRASEASALSVKKKTRSKPLFTPTRMMLRRRRRGSKKPQYVF